MYQMYRQMHTREAIHPANLELSVNGFNFLFWNSIKFMEDA